MGFGFNLGMIFIILPLTLILFLLGAFSKKEEGFGFIADLREEQDNGGFFKAIGCIWIPIVCLIGLYLITSLFSDTSSLEKKRLLW